MKNLKKINFPTASILMLTLALAMSGNARAQVTIGENLEPQSFSVLELISNNTMGMRLPQMDSIQRNEMMETQAFKDEKKGKALGLQIFNTSTLCVETWNGTKWIEVCMSCEDITFPTVGQAYNFCSNSGATIATLSAEIGGADFYDAVSGGNKYLDTETLANGTTYYAEPKVANCVAPARTAVTVNLGNCSSAPTGAKLTTFVNVMYDFQHQTIEAYNTGGIGTDYVWSVSTSGSANSFTSVDAPNSPFFTVPANFSDRYNSGDYLCDTLWFQCTISNPKGPATTDNLFNIIFIKTTSAGYGIDENTGVRYLTLQKGEDGAFNAGTMKMALLSLGQSADWTLDGGYTPNNNAGDLGDFYQWGRVADGHQNVVWSKNASHENQILLLGETPENTSDNIAYNAYVSPSYDTSTCQVEAGNYYGKFITSNDVYTWYSGPNCGLWGTANGSSRNYQGSLDFTWTHPTNNPCPLGWRIPSHWNWWDILDGNGSNSPATILSNIYFYNNTWQWRDVINNAIGGEIITNKNGEKIFFPAAGTRQNDGNFAYNGSRGAFWSSTFIYENEVCIMNFSSSNTSFRGYNFVANGACARCVATEEEP
ncbi:MAG: hypothetical protein LBS50_11710 [Prevotellaceae bacterium]|jgi:uncharacterized protein (TIGR02145 family)|nr:hypothetical protein [Prevotellaceae bacterium]